MQLNWHAYFNWTGYSISSQEYLLAMLSIKPDLDIKVTYINSPITEGISLNRQQFFV